MRIGIFTDAYKPAISGVVTSIDMLVEGLRELGDEVYIITTSYKGCEEEDNPYLIRINGWNVPFESFKGYQLVKYRKKYLKQIEALNLDVIHVHTEFSIGRMGLKISKKLNIPMTYTMHTMYEDYMHHVIHHGRRLLKKPFNSYVKKWVSRFANNSKEAIIPNKKVIGVFERFKIEAPYALIPTGIELNLFYKEKHDREEILKLRRSLGIDDNDLVFVNIGRVAPEKSLDMIVKEFAKDLKNYQAKLLIVGDGPAMTGLKELVKELEMEKYVILTGAVPWVDVPKYYQAGDVFVNASVTETQGLTYIEALASSLPLLARYDTNLEEIITENVNGLFFHDFDEFSKQSIRMIEDKELRERLTQNARDSVNKFSKEEYAKSVHSLYERIKNN